MTFLEGISRWTEVHRSVRQHRANSKPTVRSHGPVSVLDAALYVAPPPTDDSQPSNTLVCAITTPLLLQSWGRIFNSERNNLGTRLCLFSNTVDRINQPSSGVCLQRNVSPCFQRCGQYEVQLWQKGINPWWGPWRIWRWIRVTVEPRTPSGHPACLCAAPRHTSPMRMEGTAGIWPTPCAVDTTA